MADYREVQHGIEILKGLFLQPAKREPFAKALDMCYPGIALEALSMFEQWCNPGPHSIPINTYISSISEHDDEEDNVGRLSMWRALGGSIPRVAIIFRLPEFTSAITALNIMFSPVAYLDEPQVEAMLGEVVANIIKNIDFLRSFNRPVILANVFNMLLAGATCMKHKGFREEREWRAIYTPKLRFSDLVECSTEVVKGVPQLVYKIPLDVAVSPALTNVDVSGIFDRLIIGPSPYPWPMYEAFVAELTRAGVPDAVDKVWSSTIPIRS